MSNVDRPNGFRVVGTTTGANWTASVQKMFSDNDNLFMGDLVEDDTTGTADGSGARQAVGRAEASDAILGVVVGWEPDPSALERLYHKASTTYGVYICTDPNVILEAQVNNAGINAAAMGANINFTVSAGSTTTGASNMEVDGDTEGTTATLPLKLIEVVDTPDNDISSANMKVRVLINNHLYKGGTGTAGLA